MKILENKYFWGFLLFVAGVLVGHLLTVKTMPDILRVEVPYARIIRSFKPDTSKTDTIYLPGRTIYIDSTTAIGDIPVRTIISNDSIPVLIKGKQYYIPIELAITFRGILYGFELEVSPKTFDIDIKQPKPLIRFYKSLAVLIDTKKNLYSELEFGLVYKERFTLLGRVEADGDLQTKYKTGIKVNF